MKKVSQNAIKRNDTSQSIWKMADGDRPELKKKWSLARYQLQDQSYQLREVSCKALITKTLSKKIIFEHPSNYKISRKDASSLQFRWMFNIKKKKVFSPVPKFLIHPAKSMFVYKKKLHCFHLNIHNTLELGNFYLWTT